MNRYMMTTASLVALGFGAAASAATLQYGFDFTSGDVATNGAVTDDSGNGNTGLVLTGNGGAYSADIPTVGVQNATGIGSLVLDGTNSIGTDPAGATSGAGILDHNDIIAAGGLTVEVWMRNSGGTGTDAHVTSVAGLYGIVYTPDTGEIRAINGFGGDVTASLNDTEWTHVAAVYSNPTGPASDLALDIELFINGVSQGTLLASDFNGGLSRGVGVGNHTLVNSLNINTPYTGSIYEPRVSLGALDPADFTTSLPEPGSLALLGLGGLLVARRRRA